MLNVKVLGSGCPNCQRLAAETCAALDAASIAYELTKVTEYGDIASYGVLSTPALVMDEKAPNWRPLLLLLIFKRLNVKAGKKAPAGTRADNRLTGLSFARPGDNLVLFGNATCRNNFFVHDQRRGAEDTVGSNIAILGDFGQFVSDAGGVEGGAG
ncbi:MAG TPA: thioredoxin family protein, partial [Phototrophicaceae bacterium]|nr:thioredoxin family protein [Phototrophicaceae bacterium]